MKSMNPKTLLKQADRAINQAEALRTSIAKAKPKVKALRAKLLPIQKAYTKAQRDYVAAVYREHALRQDARALRKRAKEIAAEGKRADEADSSTDAGTEAIAEANEQEEILAPGSTEPAKAVEVEEEFTDDASGTIQ